MYIAHTLPNMNVTMRMKPDVWQQVHNPEKQMQLRQLPIMEKQMIHRRHQNQMDLQQLLKREKQKREKQMFRLRLRSQQDLQQPQSREKQMFHRRQPVNRNQMHLRPVPNLQKQTLQPIQANNKK